MVAKRVSPEVVEFLNLDEVASPGHFTEGAKDILRADPAMKELLHGALVFISKHYPGHEREALLQSKAFLAGVAYSAVAEEQTRIACKEQPHDLIIPEDV
jgi:hypothetical protein